MVYALHHFTRQQRQSMRDRLLCAHATGSHRDSMQCCNFLPVEMFVFWFCCRESYFIIMTPCHFSLSLSQCHSHTRNSMVFIFRYQHNQITLYTFVHICSNPKHVYTPAAAITANTFTLYTGISSISSQSQMPFDIVFSKSIALIVCTSYTLDHFIVTGLY